MLQKSVIIIMGNLKTLNLAKPVNFRINILGKSLMPYMLKVFLKIRDINL
jgi:hypothetical protein